MNMSRFAKGVILAVIQLALVGGLAAKLMYDRATRPRGWALAQTYDPSLPIRGRYLALQLHVPVEGFETSDREKYRRSAENNYMGNVQWAYFSVRDGLIVASAVGSTGQSGAWLQLEPRGFGKDMGTTSNGLEFFIPDAANVPTLKPGEEMWIEVTVPKSGPPRPIRLALKQKDGTFTPLDLH